MCDIPADKLIFKEEKSGKSELICTTKVISRSRWVCYTRCHSVRGARTRRMNQTLGMYEQSPAFKLRLVYFEKLCQAPLFLAACGPIWPKICWTFDLWSGQTCIKFQSNRSTDGRDDATFKEENTNLNLKAGLCLYAICFTYVHVVSASDMQRIVSSEL